LKHSTEELAIKEQQERRKIGIKYEKAFRLQIAHTWGVGMKKCLNIPLFIDLILPCNSRYMCVLLAAINLLKISQFHCIA
jgi:hypothetical protein